MNRSRLTHVDLFAGVGGFTLGVEATDRFSTELMADSDRAAITTFKRNRPRVRYWPGDLGKVEGDQLLDLASLAVGELDLLTAGPPCQGLSRLGRRQLDDPRNKLVGKCVELLSCLQPRMAIIENVPALGWDGHSALYDEISELLDAAGYNVHARVLDAWRFGVPQLRRRLFIVAVREDVRVEPDSAFPDEEEVDTVISARELIRNAERGEPSCPPGLSVEEAIGDLPTIPAGGGEEVTAYTLPPVSDFQKARRQNASLLLNHHAREHSREIIAKMRRIAEGGRNQEMPDEHRLRSVDKEYFSQAYGRLHRHGIAQTITTCFQNPGSGRFIHYRDTRSLTVREAARFQTFDDDFMFLGHLESQMRQVGNAVPALLAKVLADRCADLLASANTPQTVEDVA